VNRGKKEKGGDPLNGLGPSPLTGEAFLLLRQRLEDLAPISGGKQRQLFLLVLRKGLAVRSTNS
jgi:hypothetical protein